MHLDNATPHLAAFTGAMDASGREHAVVIVKGSFDFPAEPDAVCPIAPVREEPVMADTFWGEPGFSAPRVEMDFAHIKARCDVLLDANAHAPAAGPASRVTVGAAVGNWTKTLEVTGDRVWLVSVGAPKISDARPFVRMPVTYGYGFGGIDNSDPTDPPPHAYLPNPVGRGWHRVENVARLNGRPLPNVEYPADRVTLPWGRHAPAGLGPLGRGWPDRLRFGGTYDDEWMENVFPFLPRDFDPRYYQAAPEDQQIPYPRGGERVVLANLTPEGRTSFRLPDLTMPMLFSRKRAEDVSVNAPMDTLVIRPDERRVTLTWRASIPLSRDIFEVEACLIGERSKAFWRARLLGKTYYPSLAALRPRLTLPEDVE